ncbi:transcriptional regulator, XRE family [Archaeoglobus sulfaticallidus PM70-1]|uniref:Putative HTH-type transcriptional regulatory protein Asulf_00764 n=1 Tax=Archaeoglobus sulfaticallidus PM70-1 TaxID=387631 RepID=N0BES6_9EURY|nr:transcriptional regulator [Archaeoglobus sulfaticallidus]AGK60777.1 transcriptional regulator, XRE family [Archaeoglobus sulfaticallidus PM70-1]
MQIGVLQIVLKILKRAGFAVTDLVETKPRCFDIVARKEDEAFLIKVLYNIDSFKLEMAQEMKKIAKLLNAVPLVVGEKFKLDFLERGVVYNRYGLPVINTATFYDFIIDEISPMVYSAPGGYYVKLDYEKIREVREELGLSLGEMAKYLGVSRRTVKKYEEGIDTSVENALKLEELLGTYIIKAIDLKNFVKYEENLEEEKPEMEESEAEIVEQLRVLGIKVYPIKHAPFDLLTRPEECEETILTGIKQVREIKKRVKVLGRVSEVLSTKAAYIVEKKVSEPSDMVVFLMKEDLECIFSAKDFITFINEKTESTEKNI